MNSRKMKYTYKLLASSVSSKIMNFFLNHPNSQVNAFYLVNKLHLGKGSTYKWLKLFSKYGILSSTKTNNITIYQLNKNNEMAEFLQTTCNISENQSLCYKTSFKILKSLSNTKKRFLSQKDIATHTHISSGSISEKIRELNEQKFVKKHKKGKIHLYSLKSTSLKKTLSKFFTIKNTVFWPEKEINGFTTEHIRKHAHKSNWKMYKELSVLVESRLLKKRQVAGVNVYEVSHRE